MSNNQYSLFQVDFDEVYTDQSMRDAAFGYRRVSSAYTPSGIKSIDSQYTSMILYVNEEIEQVFSIDRRFSEYCHIKTREVIQSLDCHTWYVPIEFGSWKMHGYGISIKWKCGYQKDFLYNVSMDIFGLIDADTRKIRPDKLAEHIVANPHLHVVIKDNLIKNLNIYEHF
jgi:hypothetical protein